MTLPLKEATSEKHKQAERMPFNIRMFKGLLSKSEYLLYLNQQLQLFKTIESIGLPHTSLARTAKVQEDINELNSEGYYSDFILENTYSYVNYLKTMSAEEILPHVYLNYMAIMFGGQMIRNSVPSKGQLYEFENMNEAIQSIRAVQKNEWADEVNKGFDFNIAIFGELETECAKALLFTQA